MKYNIQFKKAVIEAVLIAVLASLVGFFVNFFHPKGAVIAFSRPDTAYVADELLDGRQATQTAEMTGPAAINRIQLKKLLLDNRAVLLDARLPDAWASGHLPGAINTPLEMLGRFMDQIENLPREDWIVTYCDGPPCELGEQLARELKNMGFARVAFYPEGLNDWLRAGEPIIKGGN
ncbi:rhodanese-like domain-containing protein [candidate division KSB1 bacterium]|nr:rhodanese-like domain-containing protein [candidate division KSB1 bacterium]